MMDLFSMDCAHIRASVEERKENTREKIQALS